MESLTSETTKTCLKFPKISTPSLLSCYGSKQHTKPPTWLTITPIIVCVKDHISSKNGYYSNVIHLCTSFFILKVSSWFWNFGNMFNRQTCSCGRDGSLTSKRAPSPMVAPKGFYNIFSCYISKFCLIVMVGWMNGRVNTISSSLLLIWHQKEAFKGVVVGRWGVKVK